MEDIIYPSKGEFWREVQNSIAPESLASTGDAVNAHFVRFMKTVADHVHIYINEDQDIYRCALYLINSELYELNREFCISKMLSILSINALDINVRFVVSYVLLLDCKNDKSLLELLQDYHGFKVLYLSLHHCFKTLASLGKDELEVGTIQTMKQGCTIQLDLLFQICKYLRIPSEDLQLVDTFSINYIFESLTVAYNEEDVFNSAKFKFILALNEQFMVASRDSSVPNKVFEALSSFKASSNFNECLLVYFNREEDRCLQIMISKVLYLIFNNSSTAEMFYHNDLNVLVDVLIRELTDVSEDEELITNTFLRVLFPILKNKQFNTSNYKKAELKHLLTFLSGQCGSTFWNQSETTKRLAAKCLSIDWLRRDDKEATPSFKSSQDERPPFHTNHSDTSMDSINSLISNTSLSSISKKRPPPPQPRKQLANNRAHLYSNSSTNSSR